MDFLRHLSLRPDRRKLPVVSVVVVVDTDDPRPDLLESAFESGVHAMMRRPFQESDVITCLAAVLQRHARVESVYKVMPSTTPDSSDRWK